MFRILLSGAAITALLISVLVVDLKTNVGHLGSIAITSAVAALVLLGCFLWSRRWNTGHLKPACIVRIDGRLDALVAKNHEAVLREVVKCGHVNLVLNCAGVTFIDTAGVNVLITTAKAVAPRKGAVVLTHLDGHLRKLFEFTGLEKMFPIYGRDEEALRVRRWKPEYEVSPLKTKVPKVPEQVGVR